MASKVRVVQYQGLVLPPPGIPRHGGKSDKDYVFHAKANVKRTETLAGLTVADRVLDIGCGAGRFLTGMLATFGRVNSYVGLDVKKPVIDWCSLALTDPSNGSIRFEWINVENPRYNLAENPSAIAGRVLPVDDESIDLAVLFSVFSHMRFEETAVYLKEITRVLVPGGRCYCSAFVEENVERWVENPPNYLRKWNGPLHCVRFNRSDLEALIAAAGLQIRHFAYRNVPTQQSAYVIERPAAV